MLTSPLTVTPSEQAGLDQALRTNVWRASELAVSRATTMTTAYGMDSFSLLNLRNALEKAIDTRPGDGVPVALLRPIFEASRNPYLRGLFWLSKDIYLDSLQDVADPSAKESDALRNHMEHKFMKVVDTILTDGSSSEMFNDHLGHLVERNELISRSEHVLTMSRAALIYLTLAMRHEQRFGPSAIGPKRHTMPVDLGLYRDKLKL